MPRPLLRQAALAGLLTVAVAGGVAHAALVEVEGVNTAVNALNYGRSTQQVDDPDSCGTSQSPALVEVDDSLTAVNALNVGKSRQETGDSDPGTCEGSGGAGAGSNPDGDDTAGIDVSGLEEGAVDAGLAGVNVKAVQEITAEPSLDSILGLTLVRVGMIDIRANVGNIGDSYQGPERPADPTPPSGGSDPGDTDTSPNPGSGGAGTDPGPGTRPRPGGTNPNPGTTAGPGTSMPAPGGSQSVTRNTGTGPTTQVGSTLELAGAPLGLTEMRTEVIPAVAVSPSASAAPAVAKGASADVNRGPLGRTGFPVKEVTLLGLLLIMAGTGLDLALRKAAKPAEVAS
jgi:hypothetical protein